MLLELRCCECTENGAVESLENQLLHSRQETQEFQQQICDLESRLSKTLSDIAARQTECESLESECQKLISSKNTDLVEKNPRIDRKRYLFVMGLHGKLAPFGGLHCLSLSVTTTIESCKSFKLGGNYLL